MSKRRLIYITLAVIFIAVIYSLVSRLSNYEILGHKPKTGYRITASGVYYSSMSTQGTAIIRLPRKRKSRKVNGAHRKTFKVFEKNRSFAADKNSFYSAGRKVGGMDGATTKYFNEDFYVSKTGMYWIKKRWFYENGDPETFHRLQTDHLGRGDYFKDANHVYYKNKRLVTADPESFKVLSHQYAKDVSHAYYLDKIIEGAHVVSFQHLRDEKAGDMNRDYRFGKPEK